MNFAVPLSLLSLSVKVSYDSPKLTKGYDANASLIELLNTNNIALNRTLASLENTSNYLYYPYL